jgi:hypothetical protein
MRNQFSNSLEWERNEKKNKKNLSHIPKKTFYSQYIIKTKIIIKTKYVSTGKFVWDRNGLGVSANVQLIKLKIFPKKVCLVPHK